MTFKKSLLGLFAALSVFVLAGCGDTWSGLKKDTGENMEATGKAIEKAGEKVKN
jgi:predicted small secreted protein